MATITLRNQDGHEETFECEEDTYILDALEISYIYFIRQID